MTCPKCGSTIIDIVSGQGSISQDMMGWEYNYSEHSFRCSKCGHTWVVTYKVKQKLPIYEVIT